MQNGTLGDWSWCLTGLIWGMFKNIKIYQRLYHGIKTRIGLS